MKTKYKQAHGAIIDKASSLENCFEEELRDIRVANLYKMSLESLQALAERLHLVVEDNRNALIRSIKSAIK